MSEFYRISTLWVVDFRYEGRARRWFKAFGANVDAAQSVRETLRDLYDGRAELVALRPATAEEDAQYLRGDVPKNAYCPVGPGH